MKVFGVVIVFLLLFFLLLVLQLILYFRKVFIRFRQHLTGDYDEETFKRMADKHYREKNDNYGFDKDYFKGSGNFWKGTSAGPRPKDTRQSRTTVVNHDGEDVTIIDDRSQGERKKKIFTKDEGEYVDFTEA